MNKLIALLITIFLVLSVFGRDVFKNVFEKIPETIGKKLKELPSDVVNSLKGNSPKNIIGAIILTALLVILIRL